MFLSRPLTRFFPSSRAGLWLRNERRVYLGRPGGEKARLFWSAGSGQVVRGLAWSPDGQKVEIATKSRREGRRVVVLGRNGSPVRQLRATGGAFFRDGGLAVSRRDEIYLPGESRRLASRAELERVAGFRVRGAIAVSPDPLGYERGYGRNWIALTVWGVGSKSAVLVVSVAGKVRRASPAYRAGGGEGVILGWTRSPDGRELFSISEFVPPNWHGPGDHDHCAQGGFRRLFCGSQLRRSFQSHFGRLLWATGGKTALLDNGTVITRHWKLVHRVHVPAGSFELQLQPAGT